MKTESLSLADRRGFTLVELLCVMGVIVVLLGLIVPALQSLKGAGDTNAAAYDVAGALESARTYATANNTYVWAGFYEEDGSRSSTSPATLGNGRIIISVVASKDGTMLYAAGTPTILPPGSLTQVNKLLKINNVHLKTAISGDAILPVGTGTDDETFITRPVVSSTGIVSEQIGDTTPFTQSSTTPVNYTTQFQYPVGASGLVAQYTFQKVLQFSPRGEVKMDYTSVTPSIFPLQQTIEVGLQPAHGNAVDLNSRNVTAVQISGIVGNVKVYRR